MAIKSFDVKVLDEILENMVATVGKSKDEIYKISESCRNDLQRTIEELNKVKEMVDNIIDEGDRLESDVRVARKRLSEVSMYFNRYTEEEVRHAYENAHNLQMKLTMTRQIEKQLRDKRDDLERKLIGLQETIDRADQLVTQVSVVLNYLTGDLKDVYEFIKDAKEKQEFGLKIIEAQEEERKHISREIHDGPAQMLANVMMRSDLIEKIYEQDGIDAALLEIRQLKKSVRDALYEVRHIIYDLRPMTLDDLGLVPTLKKYLQTIEDYYQTAKIMFVYIGEDRRIASKMEVALFRMIQESVQNAMKHANANTIQVKLEMMKNRITALIKDDGIGFDQSQRKEGSFGLLGMKERVELLDGALTVDSKPGRGTTVIISIPL
ncbi:sensor histidine kinase [Caldibacillus lycopersici]|uniref:Signal transduction histidine-protein kinase/phosphatase DegS n=1 Tax=Perspicuibacillus lycopersici TaxID=1325689 RepID=A0AAE3IST5_9BACI|nr:sensor histidine kinase [Perspicuibacillus lycopersici]MCU9612993.1 sensor histidine kinase [Perspicuibacillus lycopersici]